MTKTNANYEMNPDSAYEAGYAAGAAYDSAHVIASMPENVRHNAQWGADQSRADSDSYAKYRTEYEGN